MRSEVCNSDRHATHSCYIAHGVPVDARLRAKYVVEITRVHAMYVAGEFAWESTATSTCMGWLLEIRIALGLGNVPAGSSSGSASSSATQEEGMRGPENEDRGWDTASTSEFASQAQCAECRGPGTLPPVCWVGTE